MAVIHRTTMTPTKLELLTAWLPAQPWYLGGDRKPEPAKAGGFRLDDPKGEVGIEFMVVTDTSGDQPVTYQVPLAYRGEPVEGNDQALIGTSEHGVLGRRWIYDGARDPELVVQLFALVLGEAEPQMQSTSDTPDPSVTGRLAEARATSVISSRTAISSMKVTDDAAGTDIVLATEPAGRRPVLHINRVLRPGQDHGEQALGHVTAAWQLPDGATARGLFVVAHDGGARR